MGAEMYTWGDGCRLHRRAGLRTIEPMDEAGRDWARRGLQPAPARRIDLNTATFEQLRAIGLSPAEATRLLAARERRRFDALIEVKRIHGLRPGAVERLRRAGTVADE
jgi:hypothetical protein